VGDVRLVIVRTPSRIHITLIDLNASLGRIDGGIGLALEEPFIEVSAKRSDELLVSGQFKKRAHDAALRMFSALGIESGVELKVKNAYSPHIGLGSGTQVMLSVGYAISKLYKIDVAPREIARIMGRSGTSGIGTAVFEFGGFVLDGGHSTEEKSNFLPSSASRAAPSPVLARYNFPDWKIALVTPKGAEIHGEKEVDIFQRYCPLPIGEVRKLSHLILMKTLPALVEEDIAAFGGSINDIQGIGFKRIEVELQNTKVKDLLRRCQKHAYGSGLSSFGPTIYCIVEDEDGLRNEVGEEADIIFTKANNVGVKSS
jgi:beta-ribofuranosylaminobenzene 5'-phosphate synthase